MVTLFLLCLSAVYTQQLCKLPMFFPTHVLLFLQSCVILSFIQSSTAVHCFKRSCRSWGTPAQSRCLDMSSRILGCRRLNNRHLLSEAEENVEWWVGDTALMSSSLYCTIAGCTQLAYLATTFGRLFYILFLSTCTSTSLYNRCYWFCIRYAGVWLWLK